MWFGTAKCPMSLLSSAGDVMPHLLISYVAQEQQTSAELGMGGRANERGTIIDQMGCTAKKRLQPRKSEKVCPACYTTKCYCIQPQNAQHAFRSGRVISKWQKKT